MFVTIIDLLLPEEHVDAGHLHMFSLVQPIQFHAFSKSYPDDSIDLPPGERAMLK